MLSNRAGLHLPSLLHCKRRVVPFVPLTPFPEARGDDQQGSDSVTPNYLFFFTLDPVALIISYLGLQSNF